MDAKTKELEDRISVMHDLINDLCNRIDELERYI